MSRCANVRDRAGNEGRDSDPARPFKLTSPEWPASAAMTVSLFRSGAVASTMGNSFIPLCTGLNRAILYSEVCI